MVQVKDNYKNKISKQSKKQNKENTKLLKILFLWLYKACPQDDKKAIMMYSLWIVMWSYDLINYVTKINYFVPIFYSTGDGFAEYEILNILPFDSNRKCMSIIIRHPVTRQIILYCKGADSTLLPRLAPTGMLQESKVHLSIF